MKLKHQKGFNKAMKHDWLIVFIDAPKTFPIWKKNPYRGSFNISRFTPTALHLLKKQSLERNSIFKPTLSEADTLLFHAAVQFQIVLEYFSHPWHNAISCSSEDEFLFIPVFEILFPTKLYLNCAGRCTCTQPQNDEKNCKHIHQVRSVFHYFKITEFILKTTSCSTNYLKVYHGAYAQPHLFLTLSEMHDI